MCVAIPAQIKSIEGFVAEADMGGIGRKISIRLTPEVRIGDYVLVHTGYAIGIVNEDEAKETLKLFEEIARLT